MNMRIAVVLGLIAVVVCACTTPQTNPPPSISQLIGAKWVAEDIDGGGVIDDVQSTMEFTEEHRVAGRGGCNPYSGNVQIDGPKLKIEQVISTKMACAPALMDQETRFLQALEAARTFELQDTKLRIRDESGKQRLVLDKQ